MPSGPVSGSAATCALPPLVVVELAGRREVLGPHADQLARSVAEQLLGLRVGEDDRPAVQHDQRVRALREHLAEDLVGRAHGTSHLRSGRGPSEASGDIPTFGARHPRVRAFPYLSHRLGRRNGEGGPV